jgi:hypothetical protein
MEVVEGEAVAAAEVEVVEVANMQVVQVAHQDTRKTRVRSRGGTPC